MILKMNDIMAFLKHFSVANTDQIAASEYADVINALNRKAQSKAKTDE